MKNKIKPSPLSYVSFYVALLSAIGVILVVNKDIKVLMYVSFFCLYNLVGFTGLYLRDLLEYYLED